jgi:hypothetical protein
MPSDATVLLHVTVRDAVRHALVAQRVDRPIEDRRRIVSLDRRDDTVPGQAHPGIID